MEFSMYSNKAVAFLDLAANILDARIATAHADRERAIEYWKNAVQIQDRLYYPVQFWPVLTLRVHFGAHLIDFSPQL